MQITVCHRTNVDEAAASLRLLPTGFGFSGGVFKAICRVALQCDANFIWTWVVLTDSAGYRVMALHRFQWISSEWIRRAIAQKAPMRQHRSQPNLGWEVLSRSQTPNGVWLIRLVQDCRAVPYDLYLIVLLWALRKEIGWIRGYFKHGAVINKLLLQRNRPISH